MKIKTFESKEAFEAYENTFSGYNIPKNLITIIETETYIDAEVEIVCKKKSTAVKRFFESLKDYPNLLVWEDWFNSFNEEYDFLEESDDIEWAKERYAIPEVLPKEYAVRIQKINEENLFFAYIKVSKK